MNTIDKVLFDKAGLKDRLLKDREFVRPVSVNDIDLVTIVISTDCLSTVFVKYLFYIYL